MKYVAVIIGCLVVAFLTCLLAGEVFNRLEVLRTLGVGAAFWGFGFGAFKRCGPPENRTVGIIVGTFGMCLGFGNILYALPVAFVIAFRVAEKIAERSHCRLSDVQVHMMLALPGAIALAYALPMWSDHVGKGAATLFVGMALLGALCLYVTPLRRRWISLSLYLAPLAGIAFGLTLLIPGDQLNWRGGLLMASGLAGALLLFVWIHTFYQYLRRRSYISRSAYHA